MPICAIAGAGPRVGNAVANAFATAGFELALISRSSETTAPIKSELEAKGATASTYAFDITDREATSSGFAQIAEEMGSPDVVIVNPANMVMASFSQVSPAELEKTWPLMVYGPMNVTAAVVGNMIKRGAGTLIFTGGGFGIEPSVTRAPHSIAKAALRNYAYGLHLELAEKGVHAGTVTIHRPVQAGEDMERCAQSFLNMHQEAAGAWSWEMHYGR